MSRDALRQIRGGHPWVFDTSIRSVSAEGAPGDLAVVFGDRRQFVAIGLYDPASPIRLRILHAGAPQPIDAAFWETAVTTALDRRGPLWVDPATTGFRLIHGENDALGGLVVDRYGSTLVVKLYSEVWWPHLATMLPLVLEGCRRRGVEVERVVLRLGRLIRATAPSGFGEGTVLMGDRPEGPVEFLENGLRLQADVISGQKTGHFLDQRDNRALAATAAHGAKVLDVFACSGGFSLNAAARGATDVLSVDMSSRSLATAAANFELNRSLPAVGQCRHRVEVGDAFEVMQRLVDRRRRFDLVIVDPPSFASKQRDRDGALAAYERLAELGVALTETGGLYVQSSCSSRITSEEFRSVVLSAGGTSSAEVVTRTETAHGIDHPIGFPHGAYLKTLFAEVRRTR